jgi:hypothetical protein
MTGIFDLSPDDVRALLNYCPETGILTWRLRAGEDRVTRWWNARYAGHEAGVVTQGGYRKVCILGKKYWVHRIAWAWVTGEWPAANLDHANGLTDDNRIANLRLATRSQNNANSKIRPNNSVGLKGVTRSRGRYAAQIRANGRHFNLGRFDTPEEAHAVYCAAALKHFGEFFRAA